MAALPELVPKVFMDTISYADPWFFGYVYVLEGKSGSFSMMKIKFDVKSPTPLTPFIYQKPIPEGDPWSPRVTITPDRKRREGCFPLFTIIDLVRRVPNHLYESDQALVVAVKENPRTWGTRFFPRKQISAETWDEANWLIVDPKLELCQVEHGPLWSTP